MRAEGYPEASVARVGRMINKLDLKTDPENQARHRLAGAAAAAAAAAAPCARTTYVCTQRALQQYARGRARVAPKRPAALPRRQVVEDALCLVFLEHQFEELLEKEGADKARRLGPRRRPGPARAAGRAAARGGEAQGGGRAGRIKGGDAALPSCWRAPPRTNARSGRASPRPAQSPTAGPPSPTAPPGRWSTLCARRGARWARRAAPPRSSCSCGPPRRTWCSGRSADARALAGGITWNEPVFLWAVYAFQPSSRALSVGYLFGRVFVTQPSTVLSPCRWYTDIVNCWCRSHMAGCGVGTVALESVRWLRSAAVFPAVFPKPEPGLRHTWKLMNILIYTPVQYARSATPSL
jgi:hypothetical protein